MPNWGQYNLQNPAGMVMPSRMICIECGTSVPYSPGTFITYANKQVFIENTCDQCVGKKIAEGKYKLKELKDKINKIERESYERAREAANKGKKS